MTLTRLLTAAGFAVMLAAGSAHAQSTELDTDTTISVDTQGNTTTTTTTTVIDPVTGLPISASAATTAGVPASSLTTTTMGEPGTVTTRTVTNGPIPDTAENRALYGQPLSRAGKRTTPAGN
ncbi:MAG TPA: hypothetical protein VFX95_09880 [Caulobacteraceae bacterium]|nr:hypothetical protein [Caulobacteraceae bacterium]